MLVVCAAAVADAGVKKPVRTERDVAAVVVGLGLAKRQEDSLRIGIQLDPAVRTSEFGQARHQAEGGIGVRVEDINPRVCEKGRMKGEPEQPRFPSRCHARGDVEKHSGGCGERVVVEREYPSALLDDEPASCVVRRLHHRHRLLERRQRREHPLQPEWHLVGWPRASAAAAGNASGGHAGQRCAASFHVRTS